MSDNYSLIIKNGSCYIDGKLTKVDLGLSGNKIKKIGKIELNSSKVFDASNKVVLPGIIDTQVHFREPGSTNAEDLESGSRAAVLGGVTSLFEMPNTNPPTSNLVEFEKKLLLARDRFGIKPLYFFFKRNNFSFASELKTLIGIYEDELNINKESLSDYFSLMFVPSPNTIFENIYNISLIHYK